MTDVAQYELDSYEHYLFMITCGPFFLSENCILLFFLTLGGYRPLLAIACQPPGTAYAVPIQIASQSVLASLAML